MTVLATGTLAVDHEGREHVPDREALATLADHAEPLERAVRDYALVGRPETVADWTDQLPDAGADTVVGYPARGPGPLLG